MYPCVVYVHLILVYMCLRHSVVYMLPSVDPTALQINVHTHQNSVVTYMGECMYVRMPPSECIYPDFAQEARVYMCHKLAAFVPWRCT